MCGTFKTLQKPKDRRHIVNWKYGIMKCQYFQIHTCIHFEAKINSKWTNDIYEKQKQIKEV